jgi:type IV pilus assembly protein PilP
MKVSYMLFKKSQSQSHFLLIFFGVFILSACGSDNKDLEVWIGQIKAKTMPKNVNIAPLKEYITQPYLAANMVSPFSIKRMGDAVLEEPPDGARPKEPLESVPIESIQYIGLIKQQNKTTKATIKVDGKLYQVVIGNHIGQNYGKITRIDDDKIEVRELVKNGENKWTDKIVKLPLSAS